MECKRVNFSLGQMWMQGCLRLHVELFPYEKTDGLSGERFQWAPVLHFLSIYALDKLLVSIFPSPQWQDNIPCSPFQPASCSCLPLYVSFLLVFHHPTITWTSTLTSPVTSISPWTCACSFLLNQSLLHPLFLLVARPNSPHSQVLTFAAFQLHYPLLLGPAPLPSPQTHGAII